MIDSCGRMIDYLRISITDRCNLRCVYCMPEGGVPRLTHGEVLSFEEITRIVRIHTALGFRHLRLTGGEPMTRKGCLSLASSLRQIEGIESLSMTSNGLLLPGRLDEVKQAGIDSLNLSLDSLKADLFCKLTRGGDLSALLSVLKDALDLGLNVKVNAVILRGVNESEIPALALLAKEAPLCVRFIELMPIGCAKGLSGLSLSEVLSSLTKAFGEPTEDPERHGYGPARYLRFDGFAGSVGLINALSHEFCASCNRVRLTPDGQLKLCLNHTRGLDLRFMLRSGADDSEILGAIRQAILEKPARHGFREEISDQEMRRMNSIGG